MSSSHSARAAGTLASAAFALASSTLAPMVSHAASLLPHRATYELSRHIGSTDRQVASVTGRLEVVLEASCDGWRTEQALGFRLLGAEGVVAENVASLAGWESRDGRHYWFNSTSYQGPGETESIAGFARAEAADARGMVNFSQPQDGTRPLPAGTLFPTGHIEALITAAIDGERSFSRVVFDGTTAESPYEISAFFGPASEHAPADGRPGGRAWPIRLAYFEIGARAPRPEFEMSVLLFENGVAGDMVYDYGELKVDVSLVELEVQPVPACP